MFWIDISLFISLEARSYCISCHSFCYASTLYETTVYSNRFWYYLEL